MMKLHTTMKSWQYAVFALGALACLIGAFLMWEGSVLGERTTGVATVVGIVGIGLLARSSKERRARRMAV